jgi:hypothetical protein
VVVADKMTASVPEFAALLPVQLPPLAVQLVALAAVQLKLTVESVAAVGTLDVKVTTGSE